MTDVVQVDPTLVESIVARGFDPADDALVTQFHRFLDAATWLAAPGAHTLADEASALTDQYGAIGHALVIPLAVGRYWLDTSVGDLTARVRPEALLDAQKMLVRRLVTVINQTILFEDLIARSAQRLAPGALTQAPAAPQELLDAWMTRWHTFPVLAALVTSTVTRWRDAVVEMVRALDQDAADIAGRLIPAATPIEIAAIGGDAGDMHLQGRAVMLVTLGNDAQVAFKPKNLAVTDAFRGVVAAINDAGFSPPLRMHDAVVREDHAWEQFVSHRSCTDRAGVSRFYRRMGGWIRLLQTLEGRDFWLDNLIADGEHPHFIDLETILQPRRPESTFDAASGIAQARLDDSPMATDIVAMRIPIGPGIPSEELGCFATPRPYLSPFPATEIPGAPRLEDDRGYRVWTHPEHAPLLNGEPVPASGWFPDIERGFRDMAETLARMAPALLQPGGLLDDLCRHPVRTIYRDTWTCMKVAQRSVAPPLLGSYQRRHAFLQRLGTESATAQGASAVIAAEVRALGGMDVPFFTARGDSDAIYPPDAPPVPGFFDGTVRDRIRQRLQHAPAAHFESDVALLRTGFWTAHPATPAMPAIPRQPAGPPLAGSDWLAAAVAIGESIAGAQLHDDPTNPAWIALTYHPSVDLEALSPFGSDLLTGRAGLAVFLADLWHATGDPRWRTLAHGLGHQLATAISPLVSAWEPRDGLAADLARNTPTIGAFTGIGGMLAAIRYLAGTLDEPGLHHAWRDALIRIAWDIVLPQATTDPVTGGTGLILALAAHPAWRDELPSSIGETWAGLDAPARDMVLSTGARQRLGSIPDSPASRLLASRRWAIETDGAQQVPVDLETTPGNLLALIEASGPDAAAWQSLLVTVTDWIAAADPAPGTQAGIDTAELALAVYRQTGDASLRDQAAHIAGNWITTFAKTGRWFPNDLADDHYRLSSVWGLPALGSVFLRLAGAPAASSPRTLDWRPWVRS